MRIKTLSSWLAAATAAGALLAMVFASGCQVNVQSIPHPPQATGKEVRTIPHPPQETGDYKDGPRHHRRHRHESVDVPRVGSTPPPTITHPGG